MIISKEMKRMIRLNGEEGDDIMDGGNSDDVL